MRSRGAGVPPAKLPKSGNQAKIPMFSVISRPGRCDFQVARQRMESGRNAGGREGKTHADRGDSEDSKMGKRGNMVELLADGNPE